MTCSARSFGCSISSAAIRRSCSSSAAPPAGAGDGAGDDPAADQLHHRLRGRADHAQLRVAQEVHVRARVDLAQRPVQVERVGAQVQLEALGEHDLEDVAGQDVLLGHLDGLGVQLLGRAPAHLGQLVVPLRRDDQRLVERTGPFRGQGVEPAHGGVVEVVAGRRHRRRPPGGMGTESIRVTRWRQ